MAAEREVPPMAVALAYEDGDRAPRVVARGRGEMAAAILRAASAAQVPVRRVDGLVPLLMKVEVDEAIPPALYVAVAEVLAWVRRLEAGTGAP